MDNDTHLLAVFASGLAGAEGADCPLQCAQERGWVDANGVPTPEGRELSRALSDQQGTRSVFRLG